MRCLFLSVAIVCAQSRAAVALNVLKWIGVGASALVGTVVLGAVVILTIGIRMQIFFDARSAEIYLDAGIGALRVFRYKAYVGGELWYGRVNARPPMPIAKKPKKKTARADWGKIAAIAFPPPRWSLRRCYLGVTHGEDDWARASLIQGAFDTVSTLIAIGSERGKFKIKNWRAAILARGDGKLPTVNVDLVADWGVLPIILRILRIIRAKKRGAV